LDLETLKNFLIYFYAVMGILDEGYSEYTLENGLQVAMQSTPTQTIYGGLNVWCGALNQKPGEDGLAHFLEHCIIMAGTKKYTPEQVEKIRPLFGGIGASTYQNNMVMPFGILSEDIDMALDFVSETMFNPRFDEKYVEQERQRVTRELFDKRMGVHYGQVREYLGAIYGVDSPYIVEVIGDAEVVANASIDDLKEIHERGFGAKNARLLLVGDLPNDIDELIEHYFGNVKEGEYNKVKYPGIKKVVSPGRMHVDAPYFFNHANPAESSAGIEMAVICPGREHESYYAMCLLDDVFGATPNSKLFKVISEEKGLAYQISSMYNSNDNRGIMSVSGLVPAKKYEEVIDSIFEVIGCMKDNLVDEKDLEVIQRCVDYNSIKVLESNEKRLEMIIAYLERGLTIEERIENLKAVTPEMVKEAAEISLPDKDDDTYVMIIKDPLKEI
jgi:predicted Zn-dependent peptidase